jgi:hypothetical protein
MSMVREPELYELRGIYQVERQAHARRQPLDRSTDGQRDAERLARVPDTSMRPARTSLAGTTRNSR